MDSLASILVLALRTVINLDPGEADIRSQQSLGSKIAARECRKVRLCSNHVRGELNAENCLDGGCGELGLAFGPKVEVVAACAHSG